MSWLRFWPAVSWSLSQTGMLPLHLDQQNALLRLMRHRPAVLSCRPERPASHFLFMKSWSMIFWRCRLTGRPFWWPLAAALSAIWSGLPQPACCAALISSRFRPAFWPRLTAQVGGKTGINTPAGKNLVGAFHQPRLVLADIGLLASLPEREIKAGYAEVVKYGLLGDADFFDWLEKHGRDVLSGNPEAQAEAVRRSCQAKAEIVAADEREAGQRAFESGPYLCPRF